MALNLEKQLVFYGAYHHDPVNVAIHITCVPMILMTGLLFATNTPSIPLPSSTLNTYLPLNLGTAAALLYSTLYVLMEPVAGGLVAPLIIGGTAYATHLTHSSYGATTNFWALGVHVVSWVAQFIGHGKFEGRAPALLDNLVQALFLAPFFVWMEILFFFGYRQDLKQRLDKEVQQEVQKFKGKGKQPQTNGAAH